MITIVFPGGAGGNWVAYLIRALEFNLALSKPKLNYHNALKSTNVRFTHDYKSRGVFLNGDALFNIYLNVVYKFRTDDYTTSDRFEMLASECSSKLYFSGKPKDLDYNSIFFDPSRFTESLFAILDDAKINYVKNFDLVAASIDAYKSTCYSDIPHFDNFDSELWLGWCLGIMKHEYQDWPIIKSIAHAQEVLIPNRTFFADYTKSKRLNYE